MANKRQIQINLSAEHPSVINICTERALFYFSRVFGEINNKFTFTIFSYNTI